jgi:hypothetical protein
MTSTPGKSSGNLAFILAEPPITAIGALGISLIDAYSAPAPLKGCPRAGKNKKMELDSETVKCETREPILFPKGLKLPIFDYHQY